MAIAKKTGVAYTIPPNLKGSGSNSDSGTATRIGSSSTNLTNVSVTRDQTTVFGSTVIDDAYANKALSSGTFRYDDQRPVGMRVSSTLAGVSKTALLSGAGVPGQTRSIHKRESFKVVKTASGIRANKYNRYDNTWAGGYPQTGTETPGTDVAATPTRSAPGQLTYKLGQPVPVSDNDYKAKTG